MTDLAAAAQFIAAHARLIDRRRLAHLQGEGTAAEVVRALDAYRNRDGGLAQLEPDLRTPHSQPSCLIYALEILHEVQAPDVSVAVRALDWLQTVTLPDGGVPFVLPSAMGWPHAPWYDPAAAAESSLLMTAGIAAGAHRLGIEHDWLPAAASFVWERAQAALSGDAYTVRYVLDFLDATPERAAAETLLDEFAAVMPADGVLGVGAGAEGEVLRPLELAPRPGHRARRLFTDQVIEGELERLARGQQDDGGWTFTWLAWNPAVAWEWRGVVSVAALVTLHNYGALRAG